MSRDFQLPGRSPIIACEGMAATSHPLASLAAVEALRAGGTAADAAVSAVAVLCVVEPQMTGIGGGCFCMLQVPGKAVWGYNASGRAGAWTTSRPPMWRAVRSIAAGPAPSVTVPNGLAAWGTILDADGRFSLDPALTPAIRYASNGFSVAAGLVWDWARERETLR